MEGFSLNLEFIQEEILFFLPMYVGYLLSSEICLKLRQEQFTSNNAIIRNNSRWNAGALSPLAPWKLPLTPSSVSTAQNRLYQQQPCPTCFPCLFPMLTSALAPKMCHCQPPAPLSEAGTERAYCRYTTLSPGCASVGRTKKEIG